METVNRWIGQLQKFVDRPWYRPLVAVLVALDLFLLVIPSDGLLVSAILIRPKHWLRWVLWVSLGSAFGALALSALIQWDAPWLMEQVPYLFNNAGWEHTAQFINNYGVWALGLYAFSIFPQQPAVVIAALADMSLMNIFVSVSLGRFIKYLLFGLCAAYAPKYLGRLWFLRKEIDQIEHAKEKGYSQVPE